MRTAQPAGKNGTAIERMVMAHAGGGRQELTPESRTVRVKSLKAPVDLDGGTRWSPSLARFCMCDGIDSLPHKLVSIEPPGTLRPKNVLETSPVDGEKRYVTKQVPISYWWINFEFNPRAFKKTKAGFVTVANEDEARDPYFDGLSPEDRQAILLAVQGGC
jgi:hypothetical protein